MDLRDQIEFRCSEFNCYDTSFVRLQMRVTRGELPSPGPCPVCRSPMALVGRVKLLSADELRTMHEHEVSG